MPKLSTDHYVQNKWHVYETMQLELRIIHGAEGDDKQVKTKKQETPLNALPMGEWQPF